jgi:hypothetical protein
VTLTSLLPCFAACRIGLQSCGLSYSTHIPGPDCSLLALAIRLHVGKADCVCVSGYLHLPYVFVHIPYINCCKFCISINVGQFHLHAKGIKMYRIKSQSRRVNKSAGRETYIKLMHIGEVMSACSRLRNLLTYLLTPWNRGLLEKLTSKLCC